MYLCVEGDYTLEGDVLQINFMHTNTIICKKLEIAIITKYYKTPFGRPF